jgi:DNA-binding transcriptional ArsR family regulator
MNASDPVDEIVRALSRYLRQNPLASDTLEGITQWWLKSEDLSQADLLHALERMTRAGVVEATRAADGQVRYRRTALNVTVDAQLDRFIAGSGTSP